MKKKQHIHEIFTNRYKRILLLLIAATLACYQIVPVSAASFVAPPEISNRQKAHENIIFTGGGDQQNSDPCSESSSSGSLSGANNLEKIYNYLKGKGLTDVQAAGALGNISVESAGTGNPELVQFGYSPDRTKDPTTVSTDSQGRQGGWGIIMWTPARKVIGLMDTANITTPVYELGSQLDLVWWHMTHTSPPGDQNMYAQYKNITDISEATKVYMDKMEAPGDPHLDVRIGRAKEALRQWGGGSETSAGTSDTGTGGCATDGSGGIASANGFTFPLITTQAAIKKGSSLGGSTLVWCYTSQTNCHHDYKAADLMIPTGTTVIAAKSGRVQNVNGGNQHPNNVTITTDDGQGINYYTHMGANTAVVRVGQKVTAGTPLGKVGTSVDAMGTASHLHFDMLPAKYKYRPSCSGASCSGYPFIEVQPALTTVFKQLPEN